MPPKITASQHAATIPRHNAKKSVRLRLDMFHKECKRAGLHTTAAVSRAFGVNRATIERVIASGDVSSEFIVTALTVLHRARFDELFEIPTT